MKNLLTYILSIRIVPNYKITYAPAVSRKPELPIQVYKILGNPKNLAWKSHAGNRIFTAINARHTTKFIAFRADRTLSVNFSGFKLISSGVTKAFKNTLVSVASPPPLTPTDCACVNH